jgi:hypothetical protein
VDQRELLSLSTDSGEVQRIIDQLVQARLVHLHTEPDQTATVEIVHEMLITEWPTLRRWLEDSHALRGFMAELRQAAKQWETRGRPGDLVWRGATAQEALSHVKRQLLDLSAIEKAFLDEVRRQEVRGRRRKILVFSSIFAALGLVLAGGAFALVRIREEAAQAVLAKKQAEDSARRADAERATAVSAKAELQGKLDIIAEKEKQRQAAEEKARAADQSAAETKVLSAEQLAEANQALERKVAEAEAAKRQAETNEAIGRRATEEATKAKRELEKVLEQKRQEIEMLKARKRDIIDGDLKK